MQVSDLLKKVVGHIQRGDWYCDGEKIVFGEDAEQESMLGEPNEEEEEQREADEQKEDLRNQLIFFATKLLYWSEGAAKAFSEALGQQGGRTEQGEWEAEIALAHYQVANLPQMLRRWQKLDVLAVGEGYKKDKGDHWPAFFEAMRCYLHGLNEAAVIVSRSVLELVLRDKLEKLKPWPLKTSNKPNDRGEFEWYIRLAEERNLLPGCWAKEAHMFRKFSNAVVHKGRRPSDKETLDHIVKLRSLVQQIFSL